MTTVWPGTQAELQDYLAALRHACNECRARDQMRASPGPCARHRTAAILATLNLAEARRWIGVRNDPFTRQVRPAIEQADEWEPE